MSPNFRPTWQLPPGVSRGTWDYVSTASIATEYDSPDMSAFTMFDRAHRATRRRQRPAAHRRAYGIRPDLFRKSDVFFGA